jgi:hypothetical protein
MANPLGGQIENQAAQAASTAAKSVLPVFVLKYESGR